MKTLAVSWVLFVLALGFAVIYGWILNILAIMDIETFVFNGVTILRIVGIFIPPIGAFMGYFE